MPLRIPKGVLRNRNKKMKFTYDVYTGEIRHVVVPIDDMIAGIASAVEREAFCDGSASSDLVYVGESEDDFCMFALGSDYIVRLRHSPEYHDAVIRYIVSQPIYCHYGEIETRQFHFMRFCELLREFGVLGRISPVPNACVDV